VGRAEEALRDAEAAVRAAPERPITRATRGLIRLDLGE